MSKEDATTSSESFVNDLELEKLGQAVWDVADGRFGADFREHALPGTIDSGKIPVPSGEITPYQVLFSFSTVQHFDGVTTTCEPVAELAFREALPSEAGDGWYRLRSMAQAEEFWSLPDEYAVDSGPFAPDSSQVWREVKFTIERGGKTTVDHDFLITAFEDIGGETLFRSSEIFEDVMPEHDELEDEFDYEQWYNLVDTQEFETRLTQNDANLLKTLVRTVREPTSVLSKKSFNQLAEATEFHAQELSEVCGYVLNIPRGVNGWSNQSESSFIFKQELDGMRHMELTQTQCGDSIIHDLALTTVAEEGIDTYEYSITAHAVRRKRSNTVNPDLSHDWIHASQYDCDELWFFLLSFVEDANQDQQQTNS